MVTRYDIIPDFDGYDYGPSTMESRPLGDFILYDEYEDLHDKYIDMKVQFDSLKDAIANLYRDY